jgi:hypothetical protein
MRGGPPQKTGRRDYDYDYSRDELPRGSGRAAMALGNTLASLVQVADQGKIIGLSDAIEKVIKENIID